MNKNVKTLLIVAVAAVAIYLAYRWYENKKSSQAGANSTSASLGSNLNSVAPELIGGSQAGGTQVQPVLSVPVDVTISESSQMPPEESANPVVPVNSTTGNSLTDTTAAAATGGSSTPATTPGGAPTSTASTSTSTTPTTSSNSGGSSGTSSGSSGTAGLPVLQNPTAAQIKKAYAPGRAANEKGMLYINGQWYSVPQ